MAIRVKVTDEHCGCCRCPWLSCNVDSRSTKPAANGCGHKGRDLEWVRFQWHHYSR